MIAIKGKYIPAKVYNSMKETFINKWESKSVLGFMQVKKITSSLTMTYQRAI